MNKTEAAQILNLDSAATAGQVDARYEQIRAFFTVHVDIGKNLIGLAALSMSRIHEAYEALPDAPSSQTTDEKPAAQANNNVDEQHSTYTPPEGAPKPAAAAFASNAQTTGGIKAQATPPVSKDNANRCKLTAFIFPHPLNTAGELFSDQWWRVCKRAVLIALAALALLFVLPSLFDHPASSAILGPYVVPTKTTVAPASTTVAPTLPYGPTSPFPQ